MRAPQETTSTKSERPIFRPGALREYVRGREEGVLPRFVSRRAIVLLWLMTAAMGIAWAALLAMPLPLVAYGAVVPAAPGRPGGAAAEGLVAVSVAPGILSRVRVGDAVHVGEEGAVARSGRVVRLGPPAPAGEPGSAPRRADRLVFVRFADGAPPACAPERCRVRIELGRSAFWSFLASDRPPARSEP